MDKKQFRTASIIIIILCFFLYGNSLNNDYALDDEYVIVNNPLIEKGFKGIPKIFRSHYVSFEGEKHSYRPITLTTFAIEYQLFNAKPKVSHLINIVLYCITCIVLLKLLLRLFKNYHWSLAAIATFIFMVHPIHSEVVNNVKSRDELLCFLFAILSLIYFVKHIDKKRFIYFLLGAFFLFLSLMSKMTSFTFIAIIPLTLWFFTDVKFKKLAFYFGGILLLIAVIRFGLNFMLSSAAAEQSRVVAFYENPMFQGYNSISEKLPMAFYTVGYYIKLLIFPKTLIAYYGYNHVPIVGWTNIYFWLSFLIIIPSTLYSLVKIKTKQIWIYGLLYFLISISMFSNFVRPLVGIIGERFTYLPSLGFCILTAFFLYKIMRITSIKDKITISNKTPLFAILGIIFLLSSIRIINRNQDWKDVFTLLRHDIQYAENSAKLNSLLANNLIRVAQSESNPYVKNNLAQEAVNHFQKATEIYPEFSTAWNDMGAIYSNYFKDHKSSKYCFQKAVEIDSTYTYALFNLAFCNELDKEFELAMYHYNKVIELEPEHELALRQIIIVKDSLNRIQNTTP